MDDIYQYVDLPHSDSDGGTATMARSQQRQMGLTVNVMPGNVKGTL
jgi:hypothetical protein